MQNVQLESQFILGCLKDRLFQKPCDNILLIKHTYLVKRRTYFDYDLFAFAYSESDQMLRLECSYFIEQLLTYLELSHPTQQKSRKIELWEQLHNQSFYDDLGTVTKTKFFSLIGLCLYQNYLAYLSYNDKLNILPVVGEKCFNLIVDYLDDKYGEIYDNKGDLPVPKNVAIVNQVIVKFNNFLATKPKITKQCNLSGNLKYRINGFHLDFKSDHRATYQSAADFLIDEVFYLAGESSNTLTKIKQQLKLNHSIISEQKFYKMFGLCCLQIAGVNNDCLDGYRLKSLGKTCFQMLLNYLG